MSNIVVTTESLNQAQALLATDIDTIYAGEDYFGLRLPYSFQRGPLAELVQMTHQAGKQITVAVNAIMHNDRIEKVPDYLEFLAKIGVDKISVGDPGVIHLLQQAALPLAYEYDAQVLVTSARQVNFWAKHGAVGAVLAHEVPYLELVDLAPQVTVPVEVQVYGATAIHQSGRPLLHNYFDFVASHQDQSDREKGLFISEPKKPETHYSIFEDINGTHVFANNDLNLMERLTQLAAINLMTWKLDGIYTPGDDFVQIVADFVTARQAIEAGCFDAEMATALSVDVTAHHPTGRGLDTGFFDFDPKEVK